jgi:hypothetical protein
MYGNTRSAYKILVNRHEWLRSFEIPGYTWAKVLERVLKGYGINI